MKNTDGAQHLAVKDELFCLFRVNTREAIPETIEKIENQDSSSDEDGVETGGCDEQVGNF
jgi:hypothetical protein